MAERPTGRPPLSRGDPSVSVHLRVPSSQYDAYYSRAVRDGVTVPEVIRRQLEDSDDADDD